MGFKKEWKTLKDGYKTLQTKSRQNKTMAEVKSLQKARGERINKEAQAWRMKKLMQERTRIAKAKATIMKGKGQSGVSRATNWLFVGASPNKKAPVKRKRKSVQRSPQPQYVVQNGVAYPIIRRKVVKTKPKAIQKPKANFYEEWKKPLY